MSYATFLADPLRRDVYLVELYPWNPVGDAVVPLYLSSDQYVTLPSDTPSNQVYEPAVLNALNREASTDVPGTFAILADIKAGEIRLSNRLGALDALKAYAWDGRRAVVKHLGFFGNGSRLAYADAGILFDGEIRTFLCGDGDGTLYLREPEARFEQPITTRVFRGTRYCYYAKAASQVRFSFGTPAALDLTGAMTFEGWFHWAATGATANIGGWFGGSARPFTLTKDSSDHLTFADSGSVSLTSTLTVSANRWVHVAWVIESATAATLYVYDATTDTETVETFTGTGFTSRPAQSGAGYYHSYTSNFLGALIDDVRVWNVARTAEEIRGARHRPLTTSEAGDSSLVHYVPYDDGTGGTARDASGTGADGTVGHSGGVDPELWFWAMEGDESLAGTPKPDAWGQCENVPLVYVDRPGSTHFVQATKANAISAIYEGAYSNYATGSTYTTLLSFLEATTAAGQYDVLKSDAGTMVRLPGVAQYPVTADIQGDASGSGYVSTVATIVRRIVTERGTDPLDDPSELDTSSFTALDSANGSTVGLYVTGTETIAAAVDQLLASVGAVGFFNRTDRKFHVERFAGLSGSSVLTLSSRSVISLDPLDATLPVWLGRVGYRKNFRIMTESEIVGSAAGDRRAFVAKEFRYAEKRDDGTLEDHPRANEAEWPTLLVDESAAQTECARRRTLFGSEREAWRIRANTEGAQLDRLDVITLDYEDLTRAGALQQRFGYADGGKDFVVIGYGEQLEDGTTTLEVWG